MSSALSVIKTDLDAYGAQLIAVSKTKPPEAIMALYKQGHRDFGENRVQELVLKHESLPKDIRWHMIGHLQRNKVKFIAPFVHMIHSIDSEKLLFQVQKEAKKNKRIIPCLMEIKIGQEEAKHGWNMPDLEAWLENFVPNDWDHIDLRGLMGMATFTYNEEQVRQEFQSLKKHFEVLKSNPALRGHNFQDISMGMSGDYKIALQEGSTMVRIGSLLFGAR